MTIRPAKSDGLQLFTGSDKQASDSLLTTRHQHILQQAAAAASQPASEERMAVEHSLLKGPTTIKDKISIKRKSLAAGAVREHTRTHRQTDIWKVGNCVGASSTSYLSVQIDVTISLSRYLYTRHLAIYYYCGMRERKKESIHKQ